VKSLWVAQLCVGAAGVAVQGSALFVRVACNLVACTSPWPLCLVCWEVTVGVAPECKWRGLLSQLLYLSVY
jgi:hypothetical protein